MIVVELPLHCPNPLNGSHGHWAKTAKLRREQRAVVLMALRAKLGKPSVRPSRVRLVRLSAGELDDDGLAASLKAPRDSVAEFYGCDDSRKSGIKWEYAQERCKRGTFGVRVEIFGGE